MGSTAPPPFEYRRPPYLSSIPASDLSFELRSGTSCSVTTLDLRLSLFILDLVSAVFRILHSRTEKFLQQLPDRSG